LKNRCALLLAGAAAWGLCATAIAETSVYSDDFTDETLRAQWNFRQVSTGAPVLLTTTLQLPPNPPLRFLAEFGHDDIVQLNLALPQSTVAVRLQFDAYLLRTWDGQDAPPYTGPDIFGYGISGREPVVEESFSNGAGLQSYCPFSPAPGGPCEQTWGSIGALKNKLGVYVEVDPEDGSTVPAKGTAMSLAYHFDSGPVPYSAADITFDFFSRNLQVRTDQANKVIDESWGLDNVRVTAQVVPEPQTFALLLTGLLLLTFAAHRRSRFPR
jgi:hypothetical protein